MNKNQAASADQLYIKRLISEGEHQQLDFKFAINDSRKIARSLVAFANTDGGTLLVGVKDNGSIAGVRSDEEYYMVEAAANMYCKPEIPFKANKWLIEGKTVLEIIIERSNNACFANDENGNWLAYVRVNDQNILANNVLLEVWKRKTKLDGIYIEYSKAERELISYLEENEQITISKFSRLAHITLKQAEEIVINLICLDIVKIQLTEKGAHYSLNKREE